MTRGRLSGYLRYHVSDYLMQRASLPTLMIVILTGLTLSPGMNAAWPWLADLFGGRPSARSLHFIAATGIAAFIVVHLILVVLAGPINEVRSMITGRYRLPEERKS